MDTLLFISYLVFFSFIVSIIPFFKHSGIGRSILVCLFNIKVLAGIAYAKFYTLPRYYQNSDTWRFHRLSLEETRWLLKDPLSFLRDLFHYRYTTSGNVFSGENTYWNDLKSNILVKMMAIFNVITSNSYYINIILFNFLFLFGLVAAFKVLLNIFPTKKWMIISGIFLLPSTLFWCSGIHKDGLILSATGTVFYCFYRMNKRQFSFKYSMPILLCFILIFSLRNYVLFALIPALVCWRLSEKFPGKKPFIFFGIYLGGVILFFVLPHVFPSINFPSYIVNKQREFLQLSGGSVVKTDPLQPTLKGFISFLPHALDMSFLRPRVNEFNNPSYLPAIVENLLLTLLIVLAISSLRSQKKMPASVLCLFAFSVTILIICGYTIPFTGAIVRYKSLVLPFLITPLLCTINFSFMTKRSAT